jgi:hypothetical protein
MTFAPSVSRVSYSLIGSSARRLFIDALTARVLLVPEIRFNLSEAVRQELPFPGYLCKQQMLLTVGSVILFMFLK